MSDDSIPGGEAFIPLPPSRGGSQFGLRERVAPALDRAVTQVKLPHEQFLWEITCALVYDLKPGVVGPALSMTMRDWLVLMCPSPILGEGQIVSATATNLAAFATDDEAAVNVVRQLAGNLRKASAAKLHGNGP